MVLIVWLVVVNVDVVVFVVFSIIECVGIEVGLVESVCVVEKKLVRWLLSLLLLSEVLIWLS